jgi:hypothetical protein
MLKIVSYTKPTTKKNLLSQLLLGDNIEINKIYDNCNKKYNKLPFDISANKYDNIIIIFNHIKKYQDLYMHGMHKMNHKKVQNLTAIDYFLKNYKGGNIIKFIINENNYKTLYNDIDVHINNGSKQLLILDDISSLIFLHKDTKFNINFETGLVENKKIPSLPKLLTMLNKINNIDKICLVNYNQFIHNKIGYNKINMNLFTHFITDNKIKFIGHNYIGKIINIENIKNVTNSVKLYINTDTYKSTISLLSKLLSGNSNINLYTNLSKNAIEKYGNLETIKLLDFNKKKFDIIKIYSHFNMHPDSYGTLAKYIDSSHNYMQLKSFYNGILHSYENILLVIIDRPILRKYISNLEKKITYNKPNIIFIDTNEYKSLNVYDDYSMNMCHKYDKIMKPMPLSNDAALYESTSNNWLDNDDIGYIDNQFMEQNNNNTNDNIITGSIDINDEDNIIIPVKKKLLNGTVLKKYDNNLLSLNVDKNDLDDLEQYKKDTLAKINSYNGIGSIDNVSQFMIDSYKDNKNLDSIPDLIDSDINDINDNDDYFINNIINNSTVDKNIKSFDLNMKPLNFIEPSPLDLDDLDEIKQLPMKQMPYINPPLNMKKTYQLQPMDFMHNMKPMNTMYDKKPMNSMHQMKLVDQQQLLPSSAFMHSINKMYCKPKKYIKQKSTKPPKWCQLSMIFNVVTNKYDLDIVNINNTKKNKQLINKFNITVKDINNNELII